MNVPAITSTVRRLVAGPFFSRSVTSPEASLQVRMKGIPRVMVPGSPIVKDGLARVAEMNKNTNRWTGPSEDEYQRISRVDVLLVNIMVWRRRRRSCTSRSL